MTLPATAGAAAPAAALQGWRDAPRALLRACRHWHVDECGQRAAAIAYYSLLAFFPFVILLGSVASVLVGDDAADIKQALLPLRPLIPEFGAGFWDRIQDLIDKRGLLSVFSLVLLFFLSSRVTVAVDRALRAIFAARTGLAAKHRPLLRWLAAVGMTAAAMIGLGLVLTAIMLVELLIRASGSPGWMRDAVQSALVTRHGIPLLLLSGLGYLLFVLVPRVPIRTRYRIAGALFFAVSHDVAVSAWARFTGQFAPRDYVYGSFVGAVAFAGWTWVAASLLLLSAELVAELNGNRPER